MRLLPRMLGVATRSGIGMEDFGQWEPLGHKLGHELPRNPAPLAAASDYSPPELAHLTSKAVETDQVAGNRIVVEVASNDASQPFPDFGQRLMHEPPKCLPDLLQFGQEPLTDGLAQHGEFAVFPGLSRYA